MLNIGPVSFTVHANLPKKKNTFIKYFIDLTLNCEIGLDIYNWRCHIQNS